MRFILICLVALQAGLAAASPGECGRLFANDERAQIESYQGGLLKEELEFEDRFREFLNVVPESVLRAIGLAFTLIIDFPPDPDEDRHLRESLGQDWEVIYRRLNCVEASFMFFTPEEWSVVEPYFRDLGIWRFVGKALSALPTAEVPAPYVLPPIVVKQRLQMFLVRHKNELPTMDDLLAGSLLFRIGFTHTARINQPGFNLDLTKPGQRAAALAMLRDRKFKVGEKTFFLEWMFKTVVLYRDELLASDLLAQEYKQLDDAILRYHAVWEAKELLSRRHSAFLTGMFFHIQAPHHSVTGRRIRETLEQAISAHHRLLVELVSHPDAPPVVEWAAYQPYEKPSVPPLTVESDLEALLGHEKPVLQPDVEYLVQFRRNFGHRQNFRRIVFTERALSLIEQHREQVSLKDWLHALVLGIAADRGNNGLKLLQHSPVRSLPHLRIEIKVLKSGLRLYGSCRRDRYEFDYLSDEH